MGQLGYNTRGPLVDKLKNLLNDVQSSYEAFLDAHTLYQEGKMDERAYFIRMGDFLRQFSSLGFLMVKVILELDASIGREKQQQQQEARHTAATAATAAVAMVKPSPSIEQFMQGVARTPPAREVQKDTKVCIHCNAIIPARAKFCPKCGKKQQSEAVSKEGDGSSSNSSSSSEVVTAKEETDKEKEGKKKGSSVRSRKVT
ncbi:hypothetical protein HRbin04_01128 [archaeon HR04]|nr:hypothetical protein HRbin04_01128 [archaeon HR04]